MKRGDIYWATLSPRSGSEQKGNRPVIIMSHNAFTKTPNWRSIIVVPLSTSENQARRGPTAIVIPQGEGGITQDSIALCHQITTLDRQKLSQAIGSLSNSTLKEVEAGVKIAMDLS